MPVTVKAKNPQSGFGELPIEIPRDRHANFDPQIAPKHHTPWMDFDDKFLPFYGRGMTVLDI